MPKAFLVDTTRCTACRGCQLACKEWHDLPANETKQRGSHQNPPDLNPNNYKIVRFHEHLDKQGNVVWNFFPDQCRHCVTPICVDVADMAVPGAMIKDPKTGAVLVTDKIKKLSAFLAFCHDADYAARHFYKLLYVRNRANVVKLIQRRIHDFRILLCHQADSLVTDHRLFHSRDRFLSADIKADGHLRKHGKSAECYDRHRYNLCIWFLLNRYEQTET